MSELAGNGVRDTTICLESGFTGDPRANGLGRKSLTGTQRGLRWPM